VVEVDITHTDTTRMFYMLGWGYRSFGAMKISNLSTPKGEDQAGDQPNIFLGAEVRSSTDLSSAKPREA